MIKFFHHMMYPHCPDCALERQEARVCESCETLKLEIERLRNENERLLNRILEKPIIETAPAAVELKAIPPRNIPWNVRRQILESESRAQAKILNEQKLHDKNHPTISTEDLEKELLATEKERTDAR